MILYRFVPQDRSGRVCWTLHELGISHDVKNIDFRTDEISSPAFLKLNPMGRVPVLVTPEGNLTESGAICLYLAEKYGKGALAPAVGSALRAEYYQWIIFASATLDGFADRVNQIGRMEDEKEKATATALLREDFAPAALTLEKTLEKQDYLVGGEFSLADVMVAQDLYWSEDVLLPQYPKLQAYLGRLKTRPAAIAAEIFKDN